MNTMYRCLPVIALALSFFAGAASAQALPQQPYLKRNFTAAALRGEIAFLNPPAVELNGRATQLSPGSRIRSMDNMVVLSGSVTGQKAVVHYTVDDITGQVRDVWILRPDEVANTPWPRSLAEAQAWQFDTLGQRWTKP
jgi:hypothetical protein